VHVLRSGRVRVFVGASMEEDDLVPGSDEPTDERRPEELGTPEDYDPSHATDSTRGAGTGEGTLGWAGVPDDPERDCASRESAIATASR
jgi:hypothetical protein